MITDKILELIFWIPQQLIGLIPSQNIEVVQVATTQFDGFLNIFYGIGYMFPVVAVMPILISYTFLYGFKLAMAIIVRVKSFIPTMGA